jgi:hypothetical protein
VNGAPRPVALGFRATVDAIRLSIRRDAIPSLDALSSEARRAVLGGWFEHQVTTDTVLRAKASQFSLGWLSSLYVAALAGGVVSSPKTVRDLRVAVDFVDAEGVSRCLERALDAVFVADQAESEQDDTRAMARLRTLITDPDVASRLSELGDELVAASVSSAWVPQVIAASAAVAFREAFQRLCPDADVDGLVIDVDAVVDPPPTHEVIDVWLLEPDVGSGGTVEEVRRAASADPGRLGRLLSASLAPTDYEVIDWSVRQALIVAQTTGELASAFADVRGARSGTDTTAALRRLRQSLRAEGISADHGVLSSLNLRVLRPGSSPMTDAALLSALDLWNETEVRLGIELDGRSIAYAASRRPGTDLTLEQVYSLLWPRGRAARSAGRSAYSRFAELPPADPLLLRDLMRESVTELVLKDGDVFAAIAEARDVLARAGVVRIRVPAGGTTDLQAVILALVDAHIEVGSVMAYPRATGAGQSPDGPWATLELAEAIS